MAPGRCGQPAATGGGALLRGHVVAPPVARADTKEPRGWIMFRNQGSAVFAAFRQQDVQGGLHLAGGDEVEFWHDAARPCAADVRLVGREITCLGIVSCVRLGPASQRREVGLIERADVPREVLFRASGPLKALRVGDEVGFTVKGRPGREQALGITRLEPGTVRIEDVSVRRAKGRVTQVLSRPPTQHAQTYTAGKIRYVMSNERHSEVEYGPRAQARPHTLLPGDTVWFSLAVDRRTQRHCAVHVQLCPESLEQSGEQRHRGSVLLLKDDYGLVRAAADQRSIFFSTDELLELNTQVQVNDEVEYTRQETGSEQGACAVRVRQLTSPASRPTCHGHVAALLGSVGFLEPLSLDHDVLFSPRHIQGELQLGAPVEYVPFTRGSSRNLLAATVVRLLPPGSVALPRVLPGVRQGTVVRPLRYFDPHQVSYAGIIEERAEGTTTPGQRFKFGVYSQHSNEDVLLPGMGVTFQVNAEGHAANVKLHAGRLRGQVEFARTWYGYLRSDAVPGTFVCFLRSEVKGESDLLPGDTVEFRLTCNPRNSHFTASDVHACNEPARSSDACEEATQRQPKLHGSTSHDGSLHGEESSQIISEPNEAQRRASLNGASTWPADINGNRNGTDANVLDISGCECSEWSNGDKCESSEVQDNGDNETSRCQLSDDPSIDIDESNAGILKKPLSQEEATPGKENEKLQTKCECVVKADEHMKAHSGSQKHCPRVDRAKRRSTKLRKANAMAGLEGRGNHKAVPSRTSYKTLLPTHDKTAAYVVVVRQPKGPDGSNGFGAGWQKHTF